VSEKLNMFENQEVNLNEKKTVRYTDDEGDETGPVPK
jgi:hypothetical protein